MLMACDKAVVVHCFTFTEKVQLVIGQNLSHSASVAWYGKLQYTVCLAGTTGIRFQPKAGAHRNILVYVTM